MITIFSQTDRNLLNVINILQCIWDPAGELVIRNIPDHILRISCQASDFHQLQQELGTKHEIESGAYSN